MVVTCSFSSDMTGKISTEDFIVDAESEEEANTKVNELLINISSTRLPEPTKSIKLDTMNISKEQINKLGEAVRRYNMLKKGGPT